VIFVLFTAAMLTRYTIAIYVALSVPALYLLIYHPYSVDDGGLGALAILVFWVLACYRLLRIPAEIPSPVLSLG